MMNIMIVEDEPPILREIKSTVISFASDYNIIQCCYNGFDAIEYLKSTSERIDVLITDIQLPVVNGLELIEYVSQNSNNISCIILSGYNDFKYAQKAIKLNVCDYLLKPVDESELQNILNKIYKEKCEQNIFPQKFVHLVNIDTYIKEHYREPINTKLIADHFNFTPAYLSKIFRNYKNITPADYITTLRIEKSKQLLSNSSDLSVKEVALYVGYEDSLYFSKVFKKFTGVSPKNFQLDSKK